AFYTEKRADLGKNVRGRAGIHALNIGGRGEGLVALFDPGVEGKRLDDLLGLLLDKLRLLAGAFAVQHAVSHRHRHAVHVLDLGNDLFRRAAKSNVASLVGESAMTPPLE